MTNNKIKEFVTVRVCGDCENRCWCDLDTMVSCACRFLKVDGIRLADMVDDHYGEYELVERYIQKEYAEAEEVLQWFEML